MPIQMNWLYENHILHLKFEGKLTESELRQIDTFLVSSFNSSPAPLVHIIADAQNVTGVIGLKKLIGVKCVRHPRFGWIITIGALHNPAWRYIVGGLMMMFQIRHREATSMEGAITLLQRFDTSLPETLSSLPEAAADSQPV